jgi:predicted acyl esterase
LARACADRSPAALAGAAELWIPLSDGARLSARIWLPEDAEDAPVPALLEYIPYRKDDATAARGAVRHPSLGGHGYASARVDMRGSGDSDGLLRGECADACGRAHRRARGWRQSSRRP